MLNGRVFFSVAVAAGALALLAAACENSEPASNFGEGEEDSGSSAETGTFNVDAGSIVDSIAPVSCTPSLPPTFKAAWKAPTKASACSPTQLSEYFDACLTGKAPDSGDPCKAWTDANGTCASCIEPADNSGPIQWHRDRYYHTLNLAGCLALKRNEPNEGQCPASYAASIQCQRESCDDCFRTPNATFDDFKKCQASAKKDACASLEATVGQTCGTTYNDPDGGAYDCFNSGAEAVKLHFVRVEGIFCGQ
ncbi:MAG TPA: hypothetical protein VM925_26365 [Labilithrix sp.]|nr:hypothetical protein [Labilithrix sp.]